MSDEFNIKLLDCTEQLIDELIGFGELYYDKVSSNLNKQYLTWIYLENPYGSAKVCMAMNKDIIVGVIIYVPIFLAKHNHVQKAYFAMNVLTHPQYRGKNLFGLMISHSKGFFIKRDYWLVGHPNKNAIKGWRNANMQFREPLKIYLNKFSLFSFFRKSHIITTCDDLKNIPDQLLQRISNSGEFFHVLFSPEFITWRFINAVDKKYKIQLIKRDSDVIGMLITKKYKLWFDILIDVIAEPKNVAMVMKYAKRPTLIIRAGNGCVEELLGGSSWRLPFKKELPFFVSSWQENLDVDCSCISLASGDF